MSGIGVRAPAASMDRKTARAPLPSRFTHLAV
jgi:hypothetical protein